jgi:transposase
MRGGRALADSDQARRAHQDGSSGRDDAGVAVPRRRDARHSPNFNPTENALSKFKTALRKAAERTVDGLWAAIGRIIDRFTPHECTDFFVAAEYDPD